ncbi:uncharacterized protein BJX67DRAFT_391426 [Aspergillus lucknowensis]|uniref:Uncharacterized protein n=1 Tax=Aspergillus lucknowensis TaxID=176173 RepID=A0ABR4M2T6_9EURO
MWKSTLLATLFILPAAAYRDPPVLCVYPLSGVYTPLQRILFYTLLAFGVIGRRQRWLVAGALASAMTYCGAGAIQAVFLIAKARSPVVDLDAYGVFAVTSTGSLLVAPLLAWSTTLQTVEREIRMLIVCWAALVYMGGILAIATVYIRGTTEGPTCFDSKSSVDLLSPAVSTLYNATADCTYACFAEEHPLFRAAADAIAWESRLDPAFQITSVFLPTAAASIPSAVFMYVWVIRRRRQVWPLRPPPALTRIELGWLGELFGQKSRPRECHLPAPKTRQREHPRHPRLLLAYQYYFIFGSFGVFVVNIVLNELRLRDLPTNEMPYEFGQWSQWVAVALILLAQGLIYLFKHVWTEKGGPSSRLEDEEELPLWRRGREVERTSTLRSEASTFRRRNSFYV